MAGLKEIRTRISSVQSTMQITSAYKMVSAAKLRKAQDAIMQMRPYANKLFEILTSISDSIDQTEIEENIYGNQREIKNVLLIVVTSNRGMCGAFNTNVCKMVMQIASEQYGGLLAKGNVHLLTIGKKGHDFFRARGFNIFDNRNDLTEKVSFDMAENEAQKIMNSYLNGEFDRVILVYNQFKNAAVQQLTAQQLLPVVSKKKSSVLVETKENIIFEPSKQKIVEELIPKSLKVEFYKALLESIASEHGARMTAMHKATDNAHEILKDLTITYNKARQSSITTEILEIVSGANALQGK
jgi:F-type H+-transporting ATPase subunit gamma